jgi:hypothetical protein
MADLLLDLMGLGEAYARSVNWGCVVEHRACVPSLKQVVELTKGRSRFFDSPPPS